MKHASAILTCAALLAGCAAAPSVTDGAADAAGDRSAPMDSTAPADATAPMDSTAPTDSTAPADATAPVDAGRSSDGSSPADAAGTDGSTTPDGTARPDAAGTSCASNGDCGSGQVCRGIPACGARGTCAPASGCPANFDPVCGCDGRTYPNACGADQAGVGVASRGACAMRDAGSLTDGIVRPDAAAGSCATNAECPSDQACRGIAACGARGMCLPTGLCPGNFDPVCGCDGRTYSNVCMADTAGVGVASRGPCAAADAGVCRVDTGMGCCVRDEDCGGAGRAYCAPLGACAGGRATGVCKTRPPGVAQCWRDSDCPPIGGRAGTCVSPRICPCGAMCIVADAPGTCG